MEIKEAGTNCENSDWANLYDLGELQSREVSPPNYSRSFSNNDGERKADEKQLVVENRDGLKILPFEFVALEACLEAACSCLDSEVQNSYTALSV